MCYHSLACLRAPYTAYPVSARAVDAPGQTHGENGLMGGAPLRPSARAPTIRSALSRLLVFVKNSNTQSTSAAAATRVLHTAPASFPICSPHHDGASTTRADPRRFSTMEDVTYFKFATLSIDRDAIHTWIRARRRLGQSTPRELRTVLRASSAIGPPCPRHIGFADAGCIRYDVSHGQWSAPGLGEIALRCFSCHRSRGTRR